ncbi:hypothetical protein D3C76_1554310 [compost metagenome]
MVRKLLENGVKLKPHIIPLACLQQMEQGRRLVQPRDRLGLAGLTGFGAVKQKFTVPADLLPEGIQRLMIQGRYLLEIVRKAARDKGNGSLEIQLHIVLELDGQLLHKCFPVIGIAAPCTGAVRRPV